MSATLASITTRMRLNFFSQNHASDPAEPAQTPAAATQQPQTGRTFPADEVVWGIAIRNGFDELDDPWYHRGTTQHAYLEGNDNVAICGFRPPQSGPRTRRRSRLGLPTSGEHPMCGMCARMVVAPRPRVPIPVQPARAPVAVPVAKGRVPVPVSPTAVPRAAVAAAAGAPINAAPAPAPSAPPQAPAAPAPAPAAPPQAEPMATSPWVRPRSQIDEPPTTTRELANSHDGGLLERGVHTETDKD